MPKSFHITNQAKAQQLDDANSGLWLFVKVIFVLLIVIFVFKQPPDSESILAIELPSVSFPALVSNPNENAGHTSNSNQFAKYPNGDPVCGGEFWCWLGHKL